LLDTNKVNHISGKQSASDMSKMRYMGEVSEISLVRTATFWYSI